ncbi:hypothetical protein KYX90_13170 [Enterococcus lactis]|nr:hypothetical protein [Enterococcus lactis]MBX4221145.1 hypothetical protein [Enterococcus lactis]
MTIAAEKKSGRDIEVKITGDTKPGNIKIANVNRARSGVQVDYIYANRV